MTTKLRSGLLSLISTLMLSGHAQEFPSATDVTAADIDAFIDALPDDRISDRAIRVVEVGDYNVGVFGVFRPRTQPGNAIRHQSPITEIYYMLAGTGTLVTGGVIENEESTGDSRLTGMPNFAGTGIQGVVSRQVVPRDVIVIPGNTPHWWSIL